jgi:hypothetical protein
LFYCFIVLLFYNVFFLASPQKIFFEEKPVGKKTDEKPAPPLSDRMIFSYFFCESAIRGPALLRNRRKKNTKAKKPRKENKRKKRREKKRTKDVRRSTTQERIRLADIYLRCHDRDYSGPGLRISARGF